MRRHGCLLSIPIAACLLFCSCRERTGRGTGADRTAAIVAAYVNLRDRPSEGGSLISQLLFGERPEVLRRAGSWIEVRGQGGATGWIRASALGSLPKAERRAIVADPWERLGTGRSALVLPMGAAVGLARDGSGRWVAVLPGRSVPAPRAFLARAGAGGMEAMIEAARRLLGAPYLWGGMTGRGIDCSGLIHVAARVGGLNLPRDAGEQYGFGSAIAREKLRRGDLVFYTSKARPGPSHVAIYLGGQSIIQSILARGVCIASVDRPSQDLTWYGARRIWK